MPQAFFGAEVRQEGDKLTVTRVFAGTPAYDQGLNAGDQILALDNARVTRESFLARLAEKNTGESVRLAVFRFDDLKVLEIKLGSRDAARYRIVPVGQQTEAQKKIYQSWLSAAN